MKFKLGKEMGTGKGRSDSNFPGKMVSAALMPASGKRDLRDITDSFVRHQSPCGPFPPPKSQGMLRCKAVTDPKFWPFCATCPTLSTKLTPLRVVKWNF